MLTAFRRAASLVFLGALPLLLLALVVFREYATNDVAIDFHHVFYPAAERVLDGTSPYVDVADRRAAYVYTPILALLVTPFTLFPLAVAEVLASLALIACLLATPYVIGVRDWRVYGALLLWPAVVSGLQTANVTFLLALLCGLAWRWRERSALSGLAVGLAVGLKLFLWPLLFWLAATRRTAGALIGTLVALGSVLLVLPFEPLGGFVTILREQNELFHGESYTLEALLVELGIPDVAALALWLAFGVGVLLLGCRSFIGCMAAALALSPIVWLHYFALLVVPLSVAAAPLWLWLVPLVHWFAPGDGNGEAWQQALVLGAAALTLVLSARGRGADVGRWGFRRAGLDSLWSRIRLPAVR